MTGYMAAREQRILSAIRSGLDTSKQIGVSIGESYYDTANTLNRMSRKGVVCRGHRSPQSEGGCIHWRVAEASKNTFPQ